MNTNDIPASLGALLATALPVQTSLPVMVETNLMPLVWVEGKASTEAMLLQERITLLGRCMGQIPEGDLEKIYGKAAARWIYTYGNASAFFLHIVIDAPPFTVPVAVPPLHTEIAVRFPLNNVVVRLLRMIASCQRVLLNFDPEPEWVQQLPPSQGEGWAKDMGETGLALVRSSLYVPFRPDLITRLAVQLDLWEQIFKQG